MDQKSGLHTTEFYGRDSFIKGMSQPGRRVTRLGEQIYPRHTRLCGVDEIELSLGAWFEPCA